MRYDKIASPPFRLGKLGEKKTEQPGGWGAAAMAVAEAGCEVAVGAVTLGGWWRERGDE
jgi:hypothetical protein